MNYLIYAMANGVALEQHGLMMNDLETYGVGFMRDGKHVPIRDVLLDNNGSAKEIPGQKSHTDAGN